MPQTKRQKLGRDFEARVQAALLAGGYRVEGRRQVAGFQFDIVAIRDEEFGTEKKIAIECKYKSRGEVSTLEVAKFVAAFELLKTEDFSLGIVVTNADFARGAWQAAESKPSILLKNINEFEDEFLGIRRAFRISTRKYLQEQAVPNYVSLSARVASSLKGSFRLDAKALNLENDIIRTAGFTESSLSIVFGDFGSGKTTTLRRVNHRLQRLYLENNSANAPYMLYLRDYNEADISGFVEQQLRQSLNLNWSYDTFRHVLRNSKSVLLLDGFDEIAINVTEKKRSAYFSELLKLLECAHHTIISTRPSYFSSLSELEALLARAVRSEIEDIPNLVDTNRHLSQYFQSALMKRSYGSRSAVTKISVVKTYFVEGLSRPMILEFLSHYRARLLDLYGLGEEQILKRLESIYDISDLVRRPLLLDIIVYVLNTGKFPIARSDEVSASMLYNIYVQEQVKYEKEKGQQREFLTPSERLHFAQAMAIAMLNGDGSLTVTYPIVIDVIENNVDVFRADRKRILDQPMEAIATDVCVCGFLTLRFDNKFEFVHKSFYEFFVAYAAKEEIGADVELSVLKKYLPSETIYFLGGFLQEEKDLATRFSAILETGADSNSRRNIIGAMLYSEITTHGLLIRDFDFSNFYFRNKVISNCTLANLRMNENSIEQLSIRGSTLDDLRILKNKFTSLDFQDCHGNAKLFAAARVGRLTCKNSRLGSLRVEINAECNEVDLQFVEATIAGKLLAGTTVIKNSLIHIPHMEGYVAPGLFIESKVHFEVPTFEGRNRRSQGLLVNSLGERFLNMVTEWHDTDIIDAVMDRKQFQKFQKTLSNNRVLVHVYDFDQESNDDLPTADWADVVEIGQRYIAIFVHRLDLEKLRKLAELRQKAKTELESAFDQYIEFFRNG